MAGQPLQTTESDSGSSAIDKIFADHYGPGMTSFVVDREELLNAGLEWEIELPATSGDRVYSFQDQLTLPAAIRAITPKGREWTIRLAEHGLYCFEITRITHIRASSMRAVVRIPDATPSVIIDYALNDGQALLAKLRYNRLIDLFTGLTCYSLQTQLRSVIRDLGQVETAEVYLGTDRRGAHIILPVQAEGGTELISVEQIERDFAHCAHLFPDATCRPLAAQCLGGAVIALFEFEIGDDGVRITSEQHYRLVTAENLVPVELNCDPSLRLPRPFR